MPSMKTLVSSLKAEISRLARKEIAAETGTIRKALSVLRSSNAELKREVGHLKRELQQLRKGTVAARPALQAISTAPDGFRFSGKWLGAQRRRLGLSAVEMGLLLQASNQSVGKWETKGVRPHKEYMPRIAALASLSKEEAVAIVQRVQTKRAA